MASLATRLLMEPLRSLAFGSVVAGYAGVGTAIDHPARMIYISNLTDASVVLSFDGLTDHFVLSEGGYLMLDIASNKTVSQHFYLAEGERLYVKRLAPDVPTLGAVYFTVFYGKD
jgi:hypothetical protein